MNTHCLLCEQSFETDDKTGPCPECGNRMAGLEDIGPSLPAYESQAVREILEWMNRPPGVMTTAVNKVIDGVIGSAKIVVPEKVSAEISRSLARLLEFLQEVSFYTWIPDEAKLKEELAARFGEGKLTDLLAKTLPLISGKGVVQQAAELGHAVETIEDLRALELEQVDKLAAEYMTFVGNRGVAVAEGALTGLGGFALLAVDIPAITAINFRFVQQIGSCFGYNQDREQEKAFTMRVFTLAFAGEVGGGDADRETGMTAKIAAAYELKSLAFALAKQWSSAQMAEKAVLMGILTWLKRSAPQRLARHVIKRKAAASIPVLGAGISATINYALTSYTGKVAWYCFRYRKLLEAFGGLEGDEMPPSPVSSDEEQAAPATTE